MADIYQIDSYDIIDRVSTFGGTNLMRWSGCSELDKQYLQDQTIDFLGYGIKLLPGQTMTYTSTSVFYYPNNETIFIPAQTQLIISCFIYENTLTSENSSDKINSTYYQYYSGGQSQISPSFALNTTGLITYKNQDSSDRNIKGTNFSISIPSTATGYIIIGPRKVEIGNKPTDWTPCPYDLVTYDSTNQALVFFQ